MERGPFYAVVNDAGFVTMTAEEPGAPHVALWRREGDAERHRDLMDRLNPWNSYEVVEVQIRPRERGTDRCRVCGGVMHWLGRYSMGLDSLTKEEQRPVDRFHCFNCDRLAEVFVEEKG